MNVGYSDVNTIRTSRSWIPRVLIIGPGGFKGLKALGFLSPIEDSGLLQNTDTYCGVSAGAIISLLIVAGYQMREIVGEASSLNLFKDIDNITVQSIIDNQGLISNEPIRKRLTQLILNKFGTIPTLWSLYMQTGRAYIAVTLNATDEECEMMGPFTHPNMSCIDVTMFSMNIPFVFYQLIHRGKVYVDGALGNPYPVDYFDDGNTDILAIYMKTVHTKASNLQMQPGVILQRIDESTNQSLPIGSYLLKIVHALMDQRRNQIMQQSSSRCRHICLESRNMNLAGYSLTKEDKADMLVEGFNEGKAFLSQLQNNAFSWTSPKLMYTYPPYYVRGEVSTNHEESINVLSAMNSNNTQIGTNSYGESLRLN